MTEQTSTTQSDQTTDSTTTEQGTVSWDVATPESVAGQYNDRDRRYALKAYRAALSDAIDTKSPAVQYMLATGQDIASVATEEQRTVAEQAFAASLAESDKMRAARRTEQNKRSAINAALYPPAESDSGHCDANPFTEPDNYADGSDQD